MSVERGSWQTEIARAARVAVGVLFPPRCLSCGAYLSFDAALARELAPPGTTVSEARHWFCTRCLPRLIRADGGCRRCAELPEDFLDLPSPRLICGRCMVDPPPWTAAHAAFEHTGAARDAVARLKFGRVAGVAVGMAALLAQSVAESRLEFDGDEILVPIPLHDRRLGQRGFNQSALIAQGLGPRLGLKVVTGSVVRSRPTAAQTTLRSREERRRNVKGAFVVSPRIAGRKVVLVDDVMTTASTMEEMAHAVAAAGARPVAAVTFCRARGHASAS